MRSKIVKKIIEPTYQDWIRKNDYSILSSKHRGFYAEMIFKKHCKEKGIITTKINRHFSILDQIHTDYLKKTQQKELKKMDKIALDFFCLDGEKSYFAIVKMGISNPSTLQRKQAKEMKKSKVFLFRVFEDAEMLIKRINEKN